MTDITADFKIPVRPCPFCGSAAQLIHAHDLLRCAVQCCRCGSCLPGIYGSPAEVSVRWNRRSGTACVAGGRATKGISTAKKRRACRRNLALARKSKLLKRVRRQTEDVVDRLRPLREAERLTLEEQVTRSRSRLASLPLHLTI